MSETTELSLAPKEQPVTLDGKKYTLREACGHDLAVYQTMAGKQFEYDEEGEVSRVLDFTRLKARLIAMCLYDEQDKSVDEETVGKYPASVVDKLYSIAQALNGIGKTTEQLKAEAKND